MVMQMSLDEIRIAIMVPRSEVVDMTSCQREKLLGKLAEKELALQIPPRPPKNGARRTDRWMPYTRETVAAAFTEWASLHDGQTPSKADWSRRRDPERRWPRSEGELFRRAVERLAVEDRISLKTTAPCRYQPEEQARRRWHQAQRAIKTADGRFEAIVAIESDHEIVERWNPSYAEVGPDPGPYCRDCFHGCGCRPPDMSMWQYAVEAIGGLRLRSSADFHATRSQREQFGRNRQMVTGGKADVYPDSSDPAMSTVIETIDPRTH